MSCPNFASMKYGMPLICGKTYEQYEEECGEDLTYEEFYMKESDQIEFMENLAEEFTKTLEFHTVTVQNGYYISFQFCVDEKYSEYFDLDKESEHCIDNYDAHYYFDMYRSQALRKAEAEKRRIKKWLLGMRKYGMNLVYMTELYSNGEATYSIA